MGTSSKSPRQPGIIVYLCGLGTSALALWLVHYLHESQQFNIMGWYLNAIIPAGAMLVGIASGLGYAIASRVLQVKLSKAFVLGMITTAVIDYFAAQYLTYTHLLEQSNISPERYGFTDYIREICEGMAFKGRNSDEVGSPLGIWGYLFKILELGGYVLGAIVPSLTVFGMPYCKSCQQYLKNHRTAHIHSPALWSTVKKLKKNERLAALQEAIQTLAERANEIAGSIATVPLAETESAIAALDQDIQKDAAARITFTLKKCPQCEAHHLKLTLTNFTVDKNAAFNNFATIDKTE
ncbi:MAG: hypothetical protein V4599_06040 [Verrucomicrobiota bacterium]